MGSAPDRRSVVATALGSALAAAGCVPAKGQPLTTGTDVDSVLRLLRLPRRPVAARWQVQRFGSGGFPPGPTDYFLSAVLDFAPGDLDAVLAACAPSKRTGTLDVRQLPDWLRADVAERAGTDGEIAVDDIRDECLLGHPPFLEGTLHRFGQPPRLLARFGTR